MSINPPGRSSVLFALLWPLGLLILAATPAHAQVVLIGTVLEEDTEIPIAIADVRLFDSEGAIAATTLSDEAGKFRLVAPAVGKYSITVRRVGFVGIRADSVELGEGEDTELRVLLGVLAVPLEAVTVVARQPFQPARILRFRERAAANERTGRGRIYMRADIDRLQPHSADQLLTNVLWGASCRPVILLDGMPVDGPLPIIAGDMLEGVEIYRGITQIPIEFYRPGMCGLAMIWQRADPPGMKPLTWRRAAVAAAVLLFIGITAR